MSLSHSFANTNAPHPQKNNGGAGDYIVLLHGIGRTDASMKKLQNHFTDLGYQVLNIHYPSTEQDLKTLTQHIAKQVEAFNQDKSRKIHFIGYSMGGLLVRSLLNTHRPTNLGRTVLIATPNQGSEVADFLKNNWLYKKFYGPAGQELTTQRAEHITQLLGAVNYDLGVIAGDRSIDPFSSFLISGKDDGKVSLNSTKVAGMTEHVTVHATHTFIMNNKQAIKYATDFLKYGSFTPPQHNNTPTPNNGPH